MKKIINKIMILGCLVFTCVSMTGCVWDGEGDIGQMAAPESGDRPVIEGGEDEVFSYNLGYDDGLESLGEELPDADFYKQLEKRVEEYPDQIYYDLYVEGHCQAGRDNGRNWIYADEKQPLETEILYKTSMYELIADWVEPQFKHPAAEYVIAFNLKYEYPEMENITCEYSYTNYPKIVCDVYYGDHQYFGEASFDQELNKIVNRCDY